MHGFPFQRVPVISRATAESDLNLRPCQSKPSFSTVYRLEDVEAFEAEQIRGADHEPHRPMSA